jgi:hypothetical protein
MTPSTPRKSEHRVGIQLRREMVETVRDEESNVIEAVEDASQVREGLPVVARAMERDDGALDRTQVDLKWCWPAKEVVLSAIDLDAQPFLHVVDEDLPEPGRLN